MTKITSIIFSTCLVAIAPSCANAEATSTPAWCKTATVTGTLQKGTTQHPNGGKVVFHYLALKQPLTIAAGECEGVKMDKATTKEVQVKEDPKVIGKFVGKTVSVSGEIAFPENAYDVLSVILYPPITVKADNL